jgi:succinylglutamate desuccinylase
MATYTKAGHGILRIDGKRKGPAISVICNVHGNELCGRKGAQRVLQKHTIERGSLVLIDGNQEAALLNQRYVESDMNRMFTKDQLKQKKAGNDLLRAQYLAKVIPTLGLDMAIDFHSTSSETRYPFTVSFPGSEAITELCPAARIFGWPGIVEGSLVEWMNQQGIASVVVEAGQHVADKSVRVAEKTLLSILSEHGLITLKKPLKMSAQKTFKVIERVMVGDHDSFKFTRQYHSFERLTAAELIARDKTGNYHAPNMKKLYILMPSLQKNVAARLSRGAYYLMQRV